LTLGEILRKLISEKEITQKQLADSLNISASTLGNYIQNAREPDYAMLKSLADFFDVTTDYLLDRRTGQTLNYLEDELLRIFRSLKTDQKELYIEQGKLFIAQNNKKGKSSDSGITKDKTG